MPKTMQAVRFAHTGEPKEVLYVEQLPIPEPGPGQVRVRLHARPINPSDLLFIQGSFGRSATLPSPAGFEGAGIIDSVGEGVSLLPGTRVIVKANGTWQEYIIVTPAQVIPIPDRLDLESAAQFAINPLTAWLLLDKVPPNFDGWILMTAGASATAGIILRLGLQRGLRMISVVRREEQVAALKAMGAQAIINTSKENITERVQSLTKGEGISMAFEAVGGAEGTEALQCLAMGGKMVIYGLLSGQPIMVDPEAMVFTRLTIESFWLAPELVDMGPERAASVISEAMNAYCDSDLAAPVEQRYKLTEIRAAAAHSMRPGRLGKILLVG